jgi:hypothetical protein
MDCSGAVAMVNAERPRSLEGLRRPSARCDMPRRVIVVLALAAIAGALLGSALHFAEPRPSPLLTLPLFHGQGEWGPHSRPAPTFTLLDQRNASVSLASQHGLPVLIALLDARKGARSGAEGEALSQALTLVPRALRPVIDIISLDPAFDTPQGIRAATRRWHLQGTYHWLSAPATMLARARREYGLQERAPVRADAPVYLVDREGFERAGYLYPFFPTVLARDLERLYRQSD